MKRLRRWGWLLGLAPLLGLGLARLCLDADVLNLLPARLPEVRGLQLHQRYFAPETELVILVAALEAEAAEQAARSLAEALRRAPSVVDAAHWQPPGAEDPAAAAALLAWFWINQPPEIFQVLADRLEPGPLAVRLEAARERLALSLSPSEIGRLSYDPLELGTQPGAAQVSALAPDSRQFASSDGRYRVVLVAPARGRRGFTQAAAWLEEVRARVRQVQASPEWPGGVEVGFTGPAAFVAEAASGMRADLTQSVAGSLTAILGLFWLVHRRWGPLLWLGLCLLGVLLGTAALGGLLLGTLNLVSLGFAAILLGLTVDYGLILYQEARHRPAAAPDELRRWTGRAIWGSALTTAAAFALLLLGGLPGLGQLGVLVAVGVLLGAVVMRHVYLPRVCGDRAGAISAVAAGKERPAVGSEGETLAGGMQRWARPATICLLVAGGLLLGRGWPRVDHSTRPLGPRNSPAEATMHLLEAHLDHGRPSLLVLVSGATPEQVRQRLEKLQLRLETARQRGELAGFDLPLPLWPDASRQAVNLPRARALVERREAVLAALSRAGFSTEAGALAQRVFAVWEQWAAQAPPIWPEGVTARWLLARSAARTPEGWLALGTVFGPVQPAAAWAADLEGVLVCGWPQLGEVLWRHVETRLGWLTAGLVLVVAGCLRLTFGNWAAVGWSFAAVAWGGFLLLGVMALAGWTWNLMNLTAVPLLLGAGVDYSIHVQLALRRADGRFGLWHHPTGRALLLCAATTAVAFGSLAPSSNAGLAGLGAVCAVGVVCQAVSALYFLPAWAYAAHRHPPPGT